MNKVYGFAGETTKKYGDLTYKLFEEVFVSLPVATLVTASKKPTLPAFAALRSLSHPTLGPNGTKRYFVVHGGLFSDDKVGLEEVRKINRKGQKDPSGETVFGEALWTEYVRIFALSNDSEAAILVLRMPRVEDQASEVLAWALDRISPSVGRKRIK